MRHIGEVAQFSPDYSPAELKIRDEAQGFRDALMWNELGHVNLMKDTQFRVPVVIFQGGHDRGTSSTLVATWFRDVLPLTKKAAR